MWVALRSHVSRWSPSSCHQHRHVIHVRPWNCPGSEFLIRHHPWGPSALCLDIHSSMHLIMEGREILFFAICFSTSGESLFWVINDGSFIIFTKSSIFDKMQFYFRIFLGFVRPITLIISVTRYCKSSLPFSAVSVFDGGKTSVTTMFLLDWSSADATMRYWQFSNTHR